MLIEVALSCYLLPKGESVGCSNCYLLYSIDSLFLLPSLGNEIYEEEIIGKEVKPTP